MQWGRGELGDAEEEIHWGAYGSGNHPRGRDTSHWRRDVRRCPPFPGGHGQRGCAGDLRWGPQPRNPEAWGRIRQGTTTPWTTTIAPPPWSVRVSPAIPSRGIGPRRGSLHVQGGRPVHRLERFLGRGTRRVDLVDWGGRKKNVEWSTVKTWISHPTLTPILTLTLTLNQTTGILQRGRRL